jgi:hypothetical protein
MDRLPKELLDIISDFSIEKKNKDINKPQEFWILYHNINPLRGLNKQLYEFYVNNPPPQLIQVPICLIS